MTTTTERKIPMPLEVSLDITFDAPYVIGHSTVENGEQAGVGSAIAIARCYQEGHARTIANAVNAHDELVDALKTWKEFWDTMPKGQMGNLSFNVGLFNDGFVKMGRALAKAEGR